MVNGSWTKYLGVVMVTVEMVCAEMTSMTPCCEMVDGPKLVAVDHNDCYYKKLYVRKMLCVIEANSLC